MEYADLKKLVDSKLLVACSAKSETGGEIDYQGEGSGLKSA